MLSNFKAYQISKEFYWICKKLKVSFHHQDQLLRASSSVTLNLAEGSGKRTPQEQRRYYGIALESLRECQAIIELEKIDDPESIRLADELGAILYSLSRQKKPKSPRSPN